jgi:hypothetical protein
LPRSAATSATFSGAGFCTAAMLAPRGRTSMNPCISWWSALQTFEQ